MERLLPTRREFIKDSSMAAMLLLLLGTGGCESILDQIRNRPIRRMINPSSPDSVTDLDIYKNAIQMMKALPNSDRRSWWAQANIHGNLSATPACANAGSYSFHLCQHGQWFFLPWHRAYLGHFEQICRELTGEKKFGLPYWNWAIDRSVPSVFWGSTSNALFEPCRTIGATGTLPAGVYTHARLETILSDPNFLNFGSGYPFTDSRTPHGMGPLEADHGIVHISVGGYMGAGGSALDPLFYTHHCMIDYCWYDWNVNRGFDNPNDSVWFNQKWTDFVDGSGNPVTDQAGLTILWPIFSYQYEPSQIGTSSPGEALTKKNAKELTALKKRLQKGAKLDVRIKRKIPFSKIESMVTGRTVQAQTEVNISEFTNIMKNESRDRFLVNIGFADYPQDRDFFVRVFVNDPAAGVNTSIDDIHYAGSFAFFGVPMGNPPDEHHHPPLYLVDLTPALLRMQQSGLLNDNEKLTLQLVTIPVNDKVVPEQVLTLSDLSLMVSETTITRTK